MNARQVADEIVDLYQRYGDADYIGEPVSQVEHMSQTAELAMNGGYDDEVVLAAFFHDIGHICAQALPEGKMGGFGNKSHENLGADFLRMRGFSERIANLVENHVQAKRYLTFRYPEYYNALSEASKATLEFQDGKMTEEQADQFEKNPLFELSIALRRWDELAKQRNMPLIDLDVIREKILAVLN